MTHTHTRTVQDTHVLDIVGRFDSSSAEQVASQLDTLSAIPKVRVIVNMESTSFVDSTGLATLVQGLRRCQQVGGELVLCGMHRPIMMVFELTRLDQAFSIFVDEDHALQSLAL